VPTMSTRPVPTMSTRPVRQANSLTFVFNQHVLTTWQQWYCKYLLLLMVCLF